MSTHGMTVAGLFELAIAAERAAEALYRGLEGKFAHHQEVADFWRQYGDEEAMHAQWLERLRDGAAPERLAAPAALDMVEGLKKVSAPSVADLLAGVRDLEDAYQLVNELENSETNAVFGFLVDTFAADVKTHAFLRSQLRDHIGRLMIDLPAHFRHTAARREVKALAN